MRDEMVPVSVFNVVQEEPDQTRELIELILDGAA